MNRIFSLILALIFYGVIYADSDCSSGFSEKYHDEVILPQLEAWQDLAEQYIPENNNDIVAIWTNQTLDSIAHYIISNPDLSIYEQRARLSQFENTLCCGITYPYALMDFNLTPQPSQVGLDILKDSNNFMEALENVKFNDGLLILKYEGRTYLNYLVYMILRAVNLEQPYESLFDMWNEYSNRMTFIAMRYETYENETQAYRFCSLINAITSALTLRALIQNVATEDFYIEKEDDYDEIGIWLNEQADRVIAPVFDESKKDSKPIDDEEYLAIEEQIARFKVLMIEDLIEALKLEKEASLSQE